MLRSSNSKALIAFSLVVLAAACRNGEAVSPSPNASFDMVGSPSTSSSQTVFGADRPVTLHVPSNYVPGVPAPLVLALHGYGADSAFIEYYSGFGSLYETEGFLLAAPEGRMDQDGTRYWSALAADTTDETYLIGLLDEIAAVYDVDPARTYLIGHSNGGFMVYRLACHHADRFAALISMAGATFNDAGDCAPSEPVSVLQLHGDADYAISYSGGSLDVDGTPVAYPSAHGTFERWTASNACSAPATDGAARDLVTALAGEETSVLEGGGCPPDGRVELWTVAGGLHALSLSADAQAELWAWLAEHPGE